MTTEQFKEAQKLDFNSKQITKAFDDFLVILKDHEENPNFPLKICGVGNSVVEIPMHYKMRFLSVISDYFTELENKAKEDFTNFKI